MQIVDLKSMPYRDAWAMQEQIHAEVVAGAEERILVVEHPPVITLGRRAGIEANLLASADELTRRGVEVVQSDRGGDITFHGPGQVVVYPIVRLIDHHLSVGSYVRVLELAMIATLERFGIRAGKDACAIGVWVRPDASASAAKIGAVGVRVRQGVTLHGLALNVTTDLTHFSLINPCGLTGRPVTSMKQQLAEETPDFESVKKAIVQDLTNLLNVDSTERPAAPVVGEGRNNCPTPAP